MQQKKSFIDSIFVSEIDEKEYLAASYKGKTIDSFEKKSDFAILKLLKALYKVSRSKKQFQNDFFFHHLVSLLGSLRSQIDKSYSQRFGFLRDFGSKDNMFTYFIQSNPIYHKNLIYLRDNNWIEFELFEKQKNSLFYDQKLTLNNGDEILISKTKLNDSVSFDLKNPKEFFGVFQFETKQEEQENYFSVFSEQEKSFDKKSYLFNAGIFNFYQKKEIFSLLLSQLNENLKTIIWNKNTSPNNISDFIWKHSIIHPYYRGSASIANWWLNSLLIFAGFSKKKDKNLRIFSSNKLDLAPFFMSMEKFREYFKITLAEENILL